MLASFNYYPPSAAAFITGIIIGLGALAVLFLTRSALAGFFGGAISWGLIAAAVYGSGRGDMAGLAALVNGVIYGVAGAVAGLMAGLLGKATRTRPPTSLNSDEHNDPPVIS
jgi:hypothetical protein